MKFNICMKLNHLLENVEAVTIFDEVLPGVMRAVGKNPQAGELSIEHLVTYAGIPGKETVLEKLEKRLALLNTTANAVSPKEEKQMKMFQEIWKKEHKRKQTSDCHHEAMIHPGQVWLDTDGERIQAHGGMFWENGWYYWYGENKEYTDGKNGIWTCGILVYRSRDLVNWENCGYLIPPVVNDPNSPLFPTKRIERPHIVKNDRTGKYVCWIKILSPIASFTIWTANQFLGPYSMVQEEYRPGGYQAGDFDIAEDEKTGKAYVFFDLDHETLPGMERNDDFTSAVREVSSSCPHLHPRL